MEHGLWYEFGPIAKISGAPGEVHIFAAFEVFIESTGLFEHVTPDAKAAT
ncbi:hypothetical protein BJ960_000012 [Leucobacter aridicollis]|uniref:Uncharacterized protein n=1 Tax=Leucobacter aridicollis TaxID=283878 RepID=A0A852R407_9MICO|nr:hypothetical protein [Leucobacter aridicollis]NYD25209.1 hypothetical protein [Leucobacter aridicollis]